MVAAATFFIFAYNQEETIKEAIEAAVSQDFPGLEIIVSDDYSSDKTYSIILSEVQRYRGPRKILARRNFRNLGLIEHVNLAFRVSSGQLIIFAAGDDISTPDRASKIIRAYGENPSTPLLIHSEAVTFVDGKARDRIAFPANDAQDIPKRLLSNSNYYLGPTAAVSREMWKIYGEISEPNAVEDLVIGFRAELAGRSREVNEPLVFYRLGSGIYSRYEGGYLRFEDFLERKASYCQHLSSSSTQMLKDLERNPAALDVKDVTQLREFLQSRIFQFSSKADWYRGLIELQTSLHLRANCASLHLVLRGLIPEIALWVGVVARRSAAESFRRIKRVAPEISFS